jgi:translation initiation factor IF-3
LRINEEIRIGEVRLVLENSEEQPVVVSTKEALQTAYDKGLDLVEISPNAKPPVCKVMDYGRYRFEQLKRDKETKKNQKIIILKEVKLRINIEDHDFETKARNAEKFLMNKDKVKVTIMFRGREVTHPELGVVLCNRMSERLAEISNVEKPAKLEGRNMTMILTPKN